MTAILMTRPQKAKAGAYGETKSPRQFMITDWASGKIDETADRMGITRSEVLERLVRCGGLDAAEKFDPETGACRDEAAFAD